MTQEIINTGSDENSGDGDTIRVAFTKVNSNFTELYARDENTDHQSLSLVGDILSISNGNSINLSKYTDSTFSGSYNDLTDKPTLFSGSYNDLTNKPFLFSGSYNDLSDVPTVFSGDYNDLINKPVLFSGSYNDLTDVPTYFDGDYNNLTNLPEIKYETFKTSVAAARTETVDSFPATDFTSVKFYVQTQSTSHRRAGEIMLVHDGASVDIIEYSVVEVGVALGSFSADITNIGGVDTVRLTFINSNPQTTSVVVNRIGFPKY